MTDKASGLPLDCSNPTNISTVVLENIKKNLNDWPNLNYYRERNIPLVIQSNPERIVFLGDSTFENWASFPYFSNPSRINRGICGQTTPQILLRFRSDVISLHPRAVFIVGGANDIGRNTGPITFDETIGNITSMAELAVANKIEVILCSILPTSSYHFNDKDPRNTVPQTVKRPVEKIMALNAWIKQYAETHNHMYVDYFSSFVDPKGMLAEHLSNDDLHPNEVGYKIMERLTEAVIQNL